MLENMDKVRIENRANAIVAYRVPESNLIRRFVAGEIKEVAMGELRQAVQIPGTKRLIENNLIIHSKEAVDELLPGAEPEYYYTAKDVDFLLEKGTLDQLLDALDFAPQGVVDLIKERAVKTELNDVRKRDAILDQTNFNVTKAIEINHLSETKADVDVKVRRASVPVEDEQDVRSSAPVRRVAAPKYTVVK